MRKDFYIEFYNNIELILDKYIKRASLQYFFKTIFFEKTYNLKYSYNEDRLNGNSEQQCYSKLETRLLSLLPTKDFITRISKGIKLKDPINPKISFYKNSLIFYIYNNRLLDYLLPIIKEINRPTILLLEPGIYEEIEVPEWIVALEIDYELIQSDEELNYKNDSLIKGLYFKLLVNEILKIIHPDGLVFLEGCHYQEKIAAYLGKELQIPTICIQHGWQSFRHSMFSDMEYDFFLTWGKGFSIEMKKYFPNTETISCGYPYEIQSKQGDFITFFLQAPIFISDNNYFEDFLSLIENTASCFPNKKILVREHPEFKIPTNMRSKLQSYKNILIVTNLPLSYVYSLTEIAVSHFSSSLMECIIHNCIPVSYDPTDESLYTPNLKEIGVGLIVKNKQDFFTSLNLLENDKIILKEKIKELKKFWFRDIGEKAILNMVSSINIVAIPHVVKNKNHLKLNIGCGRNIKSDWVNIDINKSNPEVFQMDAGKTYPFQDNSIDYIFSEHLIEHLDIDKQYKMMSECFRVLKPEGKLRIATPGFNFLVKLYLDPYEKNNFKYIEWSYNNFIKGRIEYEANLENKSIYVFNYFMHAWGHKFIHNLNSLKLLALSAGFKNVKQCKIEESEDPNLKNLEYHQNEIPQWANELETIILEMRKSKLI